jgi:hypothetical protein
MCDALATILNGGWGCQMTDAKWWQNVGICPQNSLRNFKMIIIAYIINTGTTLIHFLFYHIFVLTIYHGYQKYMKKITSKSSAQRLQPK